MPNFNIPGVYSEIDASAAIKSLSPNNNVIGVVALSTTGTDEVAYAPSSFDDLVAKYGATNNMTKIVSTAMKNGANKFIVVKVKTAAAAADYEKALKALEQEEAVDIVLVDSNDPLIHAKVKTHNDLCATSRKERISVVGYAKASDVATVQTNALSLNQGRMFAVYPNLLDDTGAEVDGYITAAAIAGQVAAEVDPSMPMTNVEIKGFYGLVKKLNDADMDTLITSGIIPLESRNGVIRIVRLVSTYTKNAQAIADPTWREITTTRVSDYIMKDLRETLSRMFSRAKQGKGTRDAIKSEIVNKLLEYQALQYIEDVNPSTDVSINVNPTDPFRNDVTFSYNVTGPVNVIFLKGYLQI